MSGGSADGRADAVAIEVRGLAKVFGATRVLDEVNCTFGAGVTAVLGGNGAGKSTLLKLMGGVLRPSGGGGVVAVGAPLRPVRSVRQALAAGVRFAHQEGSLIPPWTVAQHFRQPASAPWRSLAPDVAGSRRIETLDAHDRQLIEVARALDGRPTAVLADEPTAGLTAAERQLVFERLRAAAAGGAVVVVVTHDLEAALAFADRVVVLRGGRIVTDRPAAGLARGDLLLAIGVDSGAARGQEALPAASPGLAEGVFTLWPRPGGEGVVLPAGRVTGLVGGPFSGAAEMVRAASGLPGTMQVGVSGRATRPGCRVAYMSREAAEWDFPGLPLRFNLNAATLRTHARAGVMDAGAEAAGAQALRELYRVVSPSLDQPAGQLSGGNRQKAVLARLAAATPDVLLLDEPFSGVDAPTRTALAAQLARLASGGMAIGVYSHELPDLIAASQDVVALGDNGRVVTMAAAAATPARIEGVLAENARTIGAAP